jgi:hypothetical protein
MTVSIRRDIDFTRVVSQTVSGDVVSSPWMPATRIDGREWQRRQVVKRGDRVIYRVNCRLKPHQRPE